MADLTITQASKEAVRESIAAFNEGRLDRIAENYTEHNRAYPGGTTSRDEIEAKMAQVGEALPDLTLTIEDMIAEGDKVAVSLTASATHEGEFYGVEPTGERIEWAATMFARVEDGVMVEAWVLRDVHGIMIQLGLIPE